MATIKFDDFSITLRKVRVHDNYHGPLNYRIEVGTGGMIWGNFYRNGSLKYLNHGIDEGIRVYHALGGGGIFGYRQFHRGYVERLTPDHPKYVDSEHRKLSLAEVLIDRAIDEIGDVKFEGHPYETTEFSSLDEVLAILGKLKTSQERKQDARSLVNVLGHVPIISPYVLKTGYNVVTYSATKGCGERCPGCLFVDGQGRIVERTLDDLKNQHQVYRGILGDDDYNDVVDFDVFIGNNRGMGGDFNNFLGFAREVREMHRPGAKIFVFAHPEDILRVGSDIAELKGIIDDVDVGAETFSQESMRKMKRSIGMPELRRVVEILRDSGVPHSYNLGAGFESGNHVQESIDFVDTGIFGNENKPTIYVPRKLVRVNGERPIVENPTLAQEQETAFMTELGRRKLEVLPYPPVSFTGESY